jgi:hypothetical protein
MLESGALAYRRLKNGELLILLISKKRSKKWGIPKGKVNASLSFGETAAKEASKKPVSSAASRPIPLVCFGQRKELPSPKILKCGFTCLKWMRCSRIGRRRKNVRLGGCHAKWPPESSVSRYSLIFVTAWRRARIAVEAWCEKGGLRPAAIQPHEARAGRVGELVALMNAVDDERLSHIGWTLRPFVASDPRLGRACEDHHCDGL